MDGWNTTFLLGRPIFRRYVSFREGNQCTLFFAQMKYVKGFSFEILLMATRNPARKPVEVGSLSHDLQGFSTIPGGITKFLQESDVERQLQSLRRSRKPMRRCDDGVHSQAQTCYSNALEKKSYF